MKIHTVHHSVQMSPDVCVCVYSQGLTPKVDHLASEEIRSLQEQNSILRAVISQMRKDMEGLSHVLPRPHSKPQASSLQPVQHPQAPAAASITPTADIQLGSAPPAKSRDISLKTSPAGVAALSHKYGSGFSLTDSSVGKLESLPAQWRATLTVSFLSSRIHAGSRAGGLPAKGSM